MINKDNAFDMFNHFSIQGKSSNPSSIDPKKYVEIKQAKRIRSDLLLKLNVLMSMKAIKGLLYIRTVLKRIQITK